MPNAAPRTHNPMNVGAKPFPQAATMVISCNTTSLNFFATPGKLFRRKGKPNLLKQPSRKDATMNLSPHLLYEEETRSWGRILRFAGEADFLAVPAVWQLLKRLLGKHIPLLVVDLSGVTFLNTPFWAAMQRYQLDGHPDSRLALCGMNEVLRAAFDINVVGLESIEGGCVAVYDHLEAAIAAA